MVSMWERASREGVTTTHLGHICFPLCPITVTRWGKNTGLDPIRWKERTGQLNHPGESANSIKSTTRKGASDIHLPLLRSNGFRRSQITFVEGGDGDRYLSTGMLMIQVRHLHHNQVRSIHRRFDLVFLIGLE